MKIYCSGIGGIGLSAYAALSASRGHTVFGSDRTDSALLDDLRSQGITVFLTQDGSAIPSDCDLFVYSEAIPESSPERLRAKELHIRSISYFEALGELSKNYFVIAVCGTHGKSSTTAMVAKMLIDAGKDPTVVVGTKTRELHGRNWREGKSDLFVLEACEYRKSFLHLSPSIALMTNVDGDHFDAYASLEEYQDAFVEFLKRLPRDGFVITHGGDPDCMTVAKKSKRPVIDADHFPSVTLQTPGAHMRHNARLALALAESLNISEEFAIQSLSGYSGSWRRMEVKGETNGVIIIDDYGHHPAEISATLEAMREAYPDRRIICVFQPHTHDRTLKLYDEFVASFRDANIVIIPDIYVARGEIEHDTVDVQKFVNDISQRSGVQAIDGKSLDETERLLRTEILKPGDVLLTMGAGNVTKLSDTMLR